MSVLLNLNDTGQNKRDFFVELMNRQRDCQLIITKSTRSIHTGSTVLTVSIRQNNQQKLFAGDFIR